MVTKPVSPLRIQNWRDDLPGLLSLLAFLAVTAFLFRSWEFALVVTASLGFHELGHAVALAWFRLDYRIHFGFVGAYTWSCLPDRQALSQLANTYIHLAGPFFSLVLALLALLLHTVWRPDSRHLLILANFSAQVGFLNLLPLGALTDGGKALRRMALSAVAFSSRKNPSRAAILLPTLVAVVIPTLALLIEINRSGSDNLPVTLLGYVLIGVWLGTSILSELLRSGSPDFQARRPMTPGQLVFVGLLVWDMLAAMMLVILATPFWLDGSYVRGSITNIELVFGWLTHIVAVFYGG